MFVLDSLITLNAPLVIQDSTHLIDCLLISGEAIDTVFDIQAGAAEGGSWSSAAQGTTSGGRGGGDRGGGDASDLGAGGPVLAA